MSGSDILGAQDMCSNIIICAAEATLYIHFPCTICCREQSTNKNYSYLHLIYAPPTTIASSFLCSGAHILNVNPHAGTLRQFPSRHTAPRTAIHCAFWEQWRVRVVCTASTHVRANYGFSGNSGTGLSQCISLCLAIYSKTSPTIHHQRRVCEYVCCVSAPNQPRTDGYYAPILNQNAWRSKSCIIC